MQRQDVVRLLIHVALLEPCAALLTLECWLSTTVPYQKQSLAQEATDMGSLYQVVLASRLRLTSDLLSHTPRMPHRRDILKRLSFTASYRG
jgi:hypothetical protein